MARGKLRRVLRKRIAIVGDGHTERIYFHQMSKFENLRIHGIDIKPELPDNKEWSKAIERAAQLADGGYDRVYAIVDLDVIYQKNRIEAFKSRWKKLKKEYKKKIKLIVVILALRSGFCFISSTQQSFLEIAMNV